MLNIHPTNPTAKSVKLQSVAYRKCNIFLVGVRCFVGRNTLRGLNRLDNTPLFSVLIDTMAFPVTVWASGREKRRGVESVGDDGDDREGRNPELEGERGEGRSSTSTKPSPPPISTSSTIGKIGWRVAMGVGVAE